MVYTFLLFQAILVLHRHKSRVVHGLGMIIHKIHQICKRFIAQERSVPKLAQSTCLGVFIAFSPYIGFHTLMAVLFCWLLSLNYGVTLAVQLLINNPWTMVPIYGCDYMVGTIISSQLNIGFLNHMPGILMHMCEPLCTRVGIPACSIWSFLIGGNILSIALAVILYYPTKWLFQRVLHEHYSSE